MRDRRPAAPRRRRRGRDRPSAICGVAAVRSHRARNSCRSRQGRRAARRRVRRSSLMPSASFHRRRRAHRAPFGEARIEIGRFDRLDAARRAQQQPPALVEPFEHALARAARDRRRGSARRCPAATASQRARIVGKARAARPQRRALRRKRSASRANSALRRDGAPERGAERGRPDRRGPRARCRQLTPMPTTQASRPSADRDAFDQQAGELRAAPRRGRSAISARTSTPPRSSTALRQRDAGDKAELRRERRRAGSISSALA